MPTPQSRHERSLLSTRSWLILSVSSLSWLLTALVVLPRWGALSGYERGCIALALPLILAAVVLARYRVTLWLPVAAMVSLGLTALVPSGTEIWTYPQTYFGYVGFILSMLLSQRAGLVSSIAIPIGVWLIWLLEPANVVPESFSVAGGSVQFIRMLGAQLLLWWAWNSLRTQADRLDLQFDSLRESELRALAEQERSGLWRESAARVHATMLNSIRALQEASEIDVNQLRVLADQGRAAIAVAPNSPRRTPVLARIEEPVNAGIVLLTSALAGALVGGSLYPFFISYTGIGWGILCVMLTMIGAATALYLVIRRRRIPWYWGLLAVVGPALVPWILGAQSYACDGIGAVSAAASIAGFAIVCIGLWSGFVPFVLGLIAWAAGTLPLAQSTESACRIAPTVILLNVATFLPLAIAFTFVGRYFNRRNLEALEFVLVASRIEETRAEALTRIDAELSSSVREAADAFDEIANHGRMTKSDEVRLACIASRIRLSVQLDVGRATGLARAAYEIVTELSRRMVPIEIDVVAYSSDDREIPQEVIDLLVGVASRGKGAQLRLQCLTTGDSDFLSLTLPRSVADAAGLETDMIRDFDDLVISVHEGTEASNGIQRSVITIERDVLQHST